MRLGLLVTSLCCLAFTACTPVTDLMTGWALDLRTKGWTDQQPLPARLKALAATAQSLGITDPFLPGGVLEGSGPALGYRLTGLDAKNRPTSRWVWSLPERDLAQEQAQKDHQLLAATAVWHCRPGIAKNSPLPSEAVGWTDAQLGEWLAWEWAAVQLGTDTDLKLAQVSFAAYALNHAMMLKLLGPGSLEFQQWLSGVQDRKTFQILSRDLKSQAQGIQRAHPDSSEQMQTWNLVSTNWLQVYRSYYARRFSSNVYRDFGKAGLSFADVAALDQDTLEWLRWEFKLPVQKALDIWQILTPEAYLSFEK